jgi:membrane protein YdbS with pleckstrin-like domain
MMFSEFELEPGEELIRETRKHWFLYVTSLLPYALLAVLPYALPNLLQFLPPNVMALDFEAVPTAISRPLIGIWLLLVWTSAWGSFTRYYLNLWVLTNRRIVEIEQRGYFSREVSITFLSRVQDVTTDIHGMLPSLLGIGTIRVQSAGATNEFKMHGIPRPEEMRDLILKYASAEPQK